MWCRCQITGFSETVIDGFNGYLVPIGKAGALAGAIDNIATERSNWKMISNVFAVLAKNKFGLRKVECELTRTYRFG